MTYNEALANRVRETLADRAVVEEKQMFGCLAFMVDGKLCICVQSNGLLLRIDPALYDALLEQNGCREMKMGNRTMKGYVYVEEAVLQTNKAFTYWTRLALNYNSQAKASRKAGKKKTTS